MDLQSLASAVLIVPAVVLAVLARRRHRTSLGLGPRHGALSEFGRGLLFSVPFFALLLVVFRATGLSDFSSSDSVDVPLLAGIWIYFLILFLVEEVVFRGLLLSGLSAFTGATVALVVTALLVAAPYLLTDHTGVLPMVGAVVTNLLHGWARLRSGRIWWGLGQRWLWNCAVLSVGFADSAYTVEHPLLRQHLDGPVWLTGGEFGVEGGVVGILFLAAMLLAATRFARPAADAEVSDRRAHPAST